MSRFCSHRFNQISNQTSSMKQSFTLNQCVRMLYGETTPEEQSMLEEIIAGNSCLRAEVESMKEMHQALSGNLLSPKAETSRAILQYSRNTALHLSC